jgi:hypothetical protein
MGGFCEFAIRSPGSEIGRCAREIADSFWRIFEILRFSGDSGRRFGSIATARPSSASRQILRVVRRPIGIANSACGADQATYLLRESLSLRRLTQGRVYFGDKPAAFVSENVARIMATQVNLALDEIREQQHCCQKTSGVHPSDTLRPVGRHQ